jgi:release factor glutamine methyltransferase
VKYFIDSFKSKLYPYYSRSEVDFLVYSLIEKFCSVTKLGILSGKDFLISTSQQQQIEDALVDLQNYKPLQYVLGEAFFCGNYFEVSQDVLIPRPETEELVSIIANTLQKNCPDASILDIGTGSACIAISLALALPKTQVTALDFSEGALEIAQKNARKMGQKIELLHQDILSWQNETNLAWDCIVSNPPYVCESEKPSMEPNVLRYEPATALFVPDDEPLLFYKKIALIAQKSLKTNGFLFFEINERFGEEIAHLLQTMNFEQIEVLKDFYGKDRFVKARKI